MDNESQNHLNLAPKEERAILDEIRNDRELIGRLKITPQELEALSKCALLGTLTCKQDMLFILRQIREAGSSTIDHAQLFPAPGPSDETEEEDPVPDLRAVRSRITPAIGLEHSAFDGIVRRRMPEQFGVLFWVVIVAIGLVWNGIIVISRWRDSFMTTIGSPVTQTSPADAWYSQFDRFSVLLVWEVMFVVLIAGFVYLRSRDTRRFKVRPGRR
jgi:hypothetical protein